MKRLADQRPISPRRERRTDELARLAWMAFAFALLCLISLAFGAWLYDAMYQFSF